MDCPSNKGKASDSPASSAPAWVEKLDQEARDAEASLTQPWKDYLAEDEKRYQGPDLAKTDCVGENPPTPSLSA